MSGMPNSVRRRAAQWSSSTAGPTTFTATSTSRRCWRRPDTGSSCPYLRGYGTTRFLSSDTPRNGQQAALAADTIALMDALAIETAIVAGFDWGARTANIVAALWPDRCKGTGVGQRISDREPRGEPITAAAAGRARLVVPVLLLRPSEVARATTSIDTTSRSSFGEPRRPSGASTLRRSTGRRRRSTTRITSAS